jgi:phospholipase C
VPCILASPYTRGNPDRPRISSYAYDHASVLRFVEWNWGLHAMTPRDASIPFTGASTKHLSNLRYALDFAHPRTKVPDLPHATPFLSSGCEIPILPPGGIPLATETARPAWDALRKSDLIKGWL